MEHRIHMWRIVRIAACIGLAVATGVGSGADAATPKDFWSFESGHVRPLALSTDGSLLAAVNTPDNRLEVFEVGATGLTHRWSVPVGMEPVSVALWGTQAWVVNHLSDSISIVDLAATPPRVARTLLLADEPRDIVFAGPGGNHAYITTARRGQNSGVDPRLLDPGVGRALVYVYDATALGSSLEGDPLEILGDAPVSGATAPAHPDVLFGDTPRALATTADGNTVYAAVFHSGNQTTAVSEQFIAGFEAAAPGVLGTSEPATNAIGEPAPSVGAIIGFNPLTSQWRDVELRNFNLFMRMTLPDLDVFEIDAEREPRPSVSLDRFQPRRHDPVQYDRSTRRTGMLYVTNTACQQPCSVRRRRGRMQLLHLLLLARSRPEIHRRCAGNLHKSQHHRSSTRRATMGAPP